MSYLAENLAAVQARIEAAARRADRQATEITLVGVSKTQPLEAVVTAYQAGLRHFGENRAEEGQGKIQGLAEWLATQPGHEPAHWHFIGHLQSRQAGTVLAAGFQLIHSVDSLKLAERLARLIERNGHSPVDILLQCNVSGEASKSGFELSRWRTDETQLADFLELVRQVAVLPHLTIRGLMTMAPLVEDPEEARPTFRSLAALKQRLQAEMPQVSWQQLSMGMTDDFEAAVEEGATLLRVGRAIFGERV
jgi:pyridoxal phosphate enzyme (YggS family)